MHIIIKSLKSKGEDLKSCLGAEPWIMEHISMLDSFNLKSGKGKSSQTLPIKSSHFIFSGEVKNLQNIPTQPASCLTHWGTNYMSYWYEELWMIEVLMYF